MDEQFTTLYNSMQQMADLQKRYKGVSTPEQLIRHLHDEIDNVNRLVDQVRGIVIEDFSLYDDGAFTTAYDCSWDLIGTVLAHRANAAAKK